MPRWTEDGDFPARGAGKLSGQRPYGDIRARIGRLHRPKRVQPATYRPGHLGNIGENLWARLKEWRAVATRYEKTARAFLGVLCMAATMDWLKAAKS